MGRLDPAVRISAVLDSLPPDSVVGLADLAMDVPTLDSINKGREEVALDKAGGQNVYTVDWPRPGGPCRLCFFGLSEHDVLDRLSVAEVMLG